MLIFGKKVSMPSSPVFTLLFLLFSFSVFTQSLLHVELTPSYNDALQPFYFGVASGDPQPTGVVIWTKIVPASGTSHDVHWTIAEDADMKTIIQSGTIQTTSKSAFTVKHYIDQLSPGQTYYYQFQHQDKYSPIGRTKTAPEGGHDLLRLAVVSCADYQMGEYNAYGHIAQRNDIDAVIHLGDYIYEGGARKWGPKRTRKSMIRSHIPAHTCQSLKDYRSRYGQYKTDPQLQECHRLHPFITIWDDHEIANNVNAGNTSPQWQERESAARQAYFEWLPIMDNKERSIIRQFSFGNLADIWMLDGRLEERTPQAKGKKDPSLYSKERYMLGPNQTDWLLEGIKTSSAKWKIMANQVIFSPMHDSKVFDRRPAIRMDRWDGYPVEQQRIFDFFYNNNLQNILVLTGDVHTAWAFELTGKPLDKNVYDRKTGKGVIGAEFVTPSISSFNLNELAPRFIAAEAKRRLKRKKHNPHLRYVDLVHHGYFTLTLTPEKAEAEWYFIKRKDIIDTSIRKRIIRGINFNGQHVYKK